ncbi:hypothetical protein [Novosphingobium naphthalenivorans]|uniref:hypothetical protein n=1 Tax=Novosphingobium naphthalenivorans TaxID=273168 RepID=UPI0012EE2115|nr:hypothetical protein [Novosphingobium naphthalenivorans]
MAISIMWSLFPPDKETSISRLVRNRNEMLPDIIFTPQSALPLERQRERLTGASWQAQRECRAGGSSDRARSIHRRPCRYGKQVCEKW